jgi:hypothetical protein
MQLAAGTAVAEAASAAAATTAATLQRAAAVGAAPQPPAGGGIVVTDAEPRSAPPGLVGVTLPATSIEVGAERTGGDVSALGGSGEATVAISAA